MKAVLLASLFVTLTAAAGSAQQGSFVKENPEQGYAWWTRAEFLPFGTEVRGIPVKKLRSDWCKANEFSRDLFPPDLASDLDSERALFTLDGFFDGSKIRQTALVGAYENCAGGRGSFLLILAWPPNRPPQIRFAHQMSAARFGVLSRVNRSTIAVFHCMSCDHFTRFRWDRTKGRFVQVPWHGHF